MGELVKGLRRFASRASRFARGRSNLASLLLGVTPTRSLAVVCSSSPFEGNGVEVLRWLLANYPGQIAWLLSRGNPSPLEVQRLLGPSNDGSRVEIRAKRSVRAVLLFARAELVLMTTAIYGGVRPTGKRLFVNVWHGDGPKTTVPEDQAIQLPAHITVAGTTAWGAEKARALGNRVEDVLVCGNPRIDQYTRPASDDALRTLGLDPTQLLVLWAPTFRKVRGDIAGTKWHDSTEAFPFRDLASAGDALAAHTARLGIQIVVKPHPLDAASYELPGVVAVTDEDLLEAGLGLYQLIARTDVLITDYSSIWTDFIVLDRPIAFFCPDLDDYAVGRGFFPNFLEHLPGPLLRTPQELLDYLDMAASSSELGSEQRRATAESLGIVTEVGATQRLMAAVGDRLGWRTAG